MPRHLDHGAHEIAFVLLRQDAADAAGGDSEAEQRRKLAGERLGRGDADLGAGQRRHHHVALAGDGRGRHVDDRQHVLLLLFGVAQRRQRVGGLARLRDEHREIARRERRLAVAEFGGDVDLDRQPREALEPVFGDKAGIVGGAAGRDRHALDLLEIERQLHRQRDPLVAHVEIVRQRMAHDLGLLVDFLRHEMAMVALVDQEGRGIRFQHRALDRLAVGVVHLDALARHHRPVAVLKIADGVGERRERDRVGAEIHFAVAVADRERRALAGADQEILLAGEQEGERERAAQPRQRGLHRLDRRLALASSRR